MWSPLERKEAETIRRGHHTFLCTLLNFSGLLEGGQLYLGDKNGKTALKSKLRQYCVGPEKSVFKSMNVRAVNVFEQSSNSSLRREVNQNYKVRI